MRTIPIFGPGGGLIRINRNCWIMLLIEPFGEFGMSGPLSRSVVLEVAFAAEVLR